MSEYYNKVKIIIFTATVIFVIIMFGIIEYPLLKANTTALTYLGEAPSSIDIRSGGSLASISPLDLDYHLYETEASKQYTILDKQYSFNITEKELNELKSDTTVDYVHLNFDMPIIRKMGKETLNIKEIYLFYFTNYTDEEIKNLIVITEFPEYGEYRFMAFSDDSNLIDAFQRTYGVN